MMAFPNWIGVQYIPEGHSNLWSETFATVNSVCMSSWDQSLVGG